MKIKTITFKQYDCWLRETSVCAMRRIFSSSSSSFFPKSPGNADLISMLGVKSHHGRSPIMKLRLSEEWLSKVGILGVYLKRTFPSWSFCITGLFGPFSITFCMGPGRFKVKAEHVFCKENEFTLKMVRHAFSGLGDLGQVTAAAPAHPSPAGLMKYGSLDCPFLSEPPPSYFWPHAYFLYSQLSVFCLFVCFIITLDLQLVLILKVTVKTSQNIRVVMAPKFALGAWGRLGRPGE